MTRPPQQGVQEAHPRHSPPQTPHDGIRLGFRGRSAASPVAAAHLTRSDAERQIPCPVLLADVARFWERLRSR
jgi:hypothetical protein